jgi:tRNA A-37 threonylcarbamoyl transferase component Bud32
MERMINFRHARPDNLALCHRALSKLHRLSIKHGDINKHKFLIHDDQATLIDFDCSLQCDNVTVLEEEFRGLEKELSDTSGRGGQMVVT